MWWTDQPERGAPFLREGGAWHGPVAEPPAWWEVLAPGRPCWRGEVSGPDRVVIDHADRSQFAAVTEGLRAGSDLPDGLAAIALTGRGFRGQRARSWEALAGNLHLTAHYKLDLSAREAQAGLTMIPAVAAVHAIEAVAPGVRPAIKWVNDILLGEAKVAGVLTATQIARGRLRHAVFGIGLNVGVAPRLPATAFVPAATCLAEHAPGLREHLPEVFAAVTSALEDAVALLKEGRGDVLFETYRGHAGFVGREVILWPEDTDLETAGVKPIARGRVLALNPDLSLTLDTLAKPVASGRMALV